jgi:hypothetical protein
MTDSLQGAASGMARWRPPKVLIEPYMGVRVNDDLVLIGGAMQGYERNKKGPTPPPPKARQA